MFDVSLTDKRRTLVKAILDHESKGPNETSFPKSIYQLINQEAKNLRPFQKWRLLYLIDTALQNSDNALSPLHLLRRKQLIKKLVMLRKRTFELHLLNHNHIFKALSLLGVGELTREIHALKLLQKNPKIALTDGQISCQQWNKITTSYLVYKIQRSKEVPHQQKSPESPQAEKKKKLTERAPFSLLPRTNSAPEKKQSVTEANQIAPEVKIVNSAPAPMVADVNVESKEAGTTVPSTSTPAPIMGHKEFTLAMQKTIRVLNAYYFRELKKYQKQFYLKSSKKHTHEIHDEKLNKEKTTEKIHELFEREFRHPVNRLHALSIIKDKLSTEVFIFFWPTFSHKVDISNTICKALQAINQDENIVAQLNLILLDINRMNIDCTFDQLTSKYVKLLAKPNDRSHFIENTFEINALNWFQQAIKINDIPLATIIWKIQRDQINIASERAEWAAIALEHQQILLQKDIMSFYTFENYISAVGRVAIPTIASVGSQLLLSNIAIPLALQPTVAISATCCSLMIGGLVFVSTGALTAAAYYAYHGEQCKAAASYMLGAASTVILLALFSLPIVGWIVAASALVLVGVGLCIAASCQSKKTPKSIAQARDTKRNHPETTPLLNSHESKHKPSSNKTKV